MIDKLLHRCGCVYLVSEKRGNQGAIDVSEGDPDQNNNQVLHKCSGECVSDECELMQQQRAPQQEDREAETTVRSKQQLLVCKSLD